MFKKNFNKKYFRIRSLGKGTGGEVILYGQFKLTCKEVAIKLIEEKYYFEEEL